MVLQDVFLQRKKSVISKIDRSHIGKWDEKVISLCEKINKLNNYYTTSSCSGRAVLMIEQEKKAKKLFLAVSHKLISFNWLKENLEKALNNLPSRIIKFKCEPPILHIVCKDLKNASEMLEKAKKSKLKHSGIHFIGKRIILEINGSDRLEFPVINKNKVLVNDDFLMLVVRQANEKLKKGWIKIKILKKEIKS